MFNRCLSLKNINLSNFNFNKVIDIRSMFDGCSSLVKLDLYHSNINKDADMEFMFRGCKNLYKHNIITKDKRILNQHIYHLW